MLKPLVSKTSGGGAESLGMHRLDEAECPHRVAEDFRESVRAIDRHPVNAASRRSSKRCDRSRRF